ncbi:hypothetical protein [Sporolactobacillus terrae]|nr:hypothetical protein [Sporolactobacillus terrae]
MLMGSVNLNLYQTVIAIVHRKNDDDDKKVVTNKTHRYSKQQIMALVEFQERFFDSEIIMD